MDATVKFAICPEVFAVIVLATISPVIFAEDAVICPVDVNIKLLFELDIALDVKAKPAIVPVPVTDKFPPIVVVPPISVLPLNNALDAVISPFCFTLNPNLRALFDVSDSLLHKSLNSLSSFSFFSKISILNIKFFIFIYKNFFLKI